MAALFLAALFLAALFLAVTFFVATFFAAATVDGVLERADSSGRSAIALAARFVERAPAIEETFPTAVPWPFDETLFRAPAAPSPHEIPREEASTLSSDVEKYLHRCDECDLIPSDQEFLPPTCASVHHGDGAGPHLQRSCDRPGDRLVGLALRRHRSDTNREGAIEATLHVVAMPAGSDVHHDLNAAIHGTHR